MVIIVQEDLPLLRILNQLTALHIVSLWSTSTENFSNLYMYLDTYAPHGLMVQKITDSVYIIISG
jgi:hypothetical protein